MRPLGAALALLAVAAAAHGDDPPCAAPDTCPRQGRPGEVAIVFVGDTGYGQGGHSEWGTHAQGHVAERMSGLCPRPDLVYFLGDNVYWTGSPDLFARRFDSVYQPLFDPERRRIHAALGNHDVKGCRLSAQAAFTPAEETCADALRRLVRVDVQRDVPPGQPAPDAPAGLAPEVMDRARGVDPTACPPAFDAAYEQDEAVGGTCYATEALRHAPFGYGLQGQDPLRYYSVDWPPPGQPAADAPAVRVLVTDSNTLDDEPEPPRGKETVGPDRPDELQLLWVENQLRTAPLESWRILAMHHPPYTPQGCVFRFLGRCVGGHGDDLVLRGRLRSAYPGPAEDPRHATHARHRPDLVFAAHNHFYARSLALDADGYPARVPGDGIRYFVSGGGGAPLYRMQPRHGRYAAAGVFHHFVYMRIRRDEAFFWVIDERGGVRDSGCFSRGDNRDRCIAAGTHDSDVVTCGADVPAPQSCPPPAR